MTQAVIAPLVLAVALLVLPVSPRRRLVPRGRRARPGTLGVRVVVVIAVALLFLTAATPFVGTAAAVLGATLWWRRRRRLARRRATTDGTRMESALDALVSELRVGAHPVHAFRNAATETGGVIGAAFGAVAARAALGADVPAGLRAAARRSALRFEWDRLALCWQLAAEHGLSIAVLMRAVQTDIAERQRFSARMQAGMAGARATAAILAGLPLVGVALGELIGAAPVSFLTGSAAGGWLLVAGVTLVCCGLLWADRITDRLRS